MRKCFFWFSRRSFRRALSPWTLCVALLLAVQPAQAQFEHLPAPLQRAIQAQGLSPDSVGLWVQRVPDGAVLARLNADTPYNPASTVKLATSLAALHELGPNYTWTTEIWATRPIQDGVLRGDLVIRGTGDPGMVSEEYWRMIGELRRTGLKRIEGDVILDASHFQLPNGNPGDFNRQPLRAYNQLPYALHVNSNSQRFHVRPERRGNGIDVVVDPPLPGLEVVNRLQPTRGGCGEWQRGIQFNVDQDAQRVTFSGQYPVNCGNYEMLRSVLSPEANHAEMFRMAWDQWGGELTGRVRTGVLPVLHDEPIVRHRSRPLSDLIRVSNKWSSNVMSDHLLLTLGARKNGPPATMDKGREALVDSLRDLGVDVGGMVVDNGSGLSRDARMTARQLGEILEAGWKHPHRPEFQSSLALSGLDGTLRNRFRNGDLRGQMHLKTGHINEVSAVAGYVRTSSGDDVIVTVLVNGPRAHIGHGRNLQDAVLEWAHGL
ncbi:MULTISPECIES: D-alanyl-D-alanine carboxypeptidase/D-alanyl-D-alanine-endopeptidase [unclassified Thioalkalivibrio]|uniref:D-alanyl-D-alanine carboxypeptidase/D-alanyl-D-alanine endopeptidase n=1 Tax=unclassified Thioalkalivibrio TaxID=2621013 RepID=UPI00037E8324|nr:MULTISPECIES: D-alanyl-D-alanine carboxypeptidase/D-alanyl-D-alanine-endopeptidase [unclassified Thioalkalivibrio]